jgi:hypothetical protein
MADQADLTNGFPQQSEGRACRVRRIRMDDHTQFGGPDKQVPPRSGRDKRVAPKVGGARSSCPPKRNRLSNVALRTRQARPSEGMKGYARRARRSEIDYQTLRCGRDKRVAPKVGGARSSCPPKRNRLSNVALRTRQARPSEGMKGYARRARRSLSFPMKRRHAKCAEVPASET